jgi:hypothetical protein
MNRPRPPVVTPPAQTLPVPAPPDALVLFDGTDVSQWEATDGTPTRWRVEDGAMISVAGAGYIQTKQAFGDVQLHVEWAAPVPVQGSGQGRGNSGVFLMGRYEVQVLDSYENETYADGQAAAIYGQHPPLANAARPPGEWQAYDIFFRRPRFGAAAGLLEPARVTVVHNGLVVQNNVEPWGPTNWLQTLPYEPHPDKLPLAFQDHGNPVRYRNIWVRELRETTDPGPPSGDEKPLITMAPDMLDRYTGKYQIGRQGGIVITREGSRLFAQVLTVKGLELVTNSPEEFSFRWTAAKLVFDLNSEGMPTGVTFHVGGDEMRAKKID